MFQNLQKVIAYLLPAGSWSEIWPVLLNVFFGVPLPLSSFLMIIICVFTDLCLSLSLIMEKEEFDLLSLPPRRPRKDHLINLRIYGQAYGFIGAMETITAHSMFFFYMYRKAGIPIRSLFFAFGKYKAGWVLRGRTHPLQLTGPVRLLRDPGHFAMGQYFVCPQQAHVSPADRPYPSCTSQRFAAPRYVSFPLYRHFRDRGSRYPASLQHNLCANRVLAYPARPGIWHSLHG